jgi:hypothetical protein
MIFMDFKRRILSTNSGSYSVQNLPFFLPRARILKYAEL